jgi:hypothetical protein
MLYDHTHVVSPEQITDAVAWVCERFAGSTVSTEPDDGAYQSA